MWTFLVVTVDSGNGYKMVCCGYVELFSFFSDRDEEEMNKREDRKEGNKHCKERASKDKVINTFLNNCIDLGRDVLITA